MNFAITQKRVRRLFNSPPMQNDAVAAEPNSKNNEKKKTTHRMREIDYEQCAEAQRKKWIWFDL